MFHARATFAYLGLTLLPLISWVDGAKANVAYSYQVDNNEIYEIVVASEKSETDLQPGIYAIDKKTGESIPLLHGEVLGANRSYKGILGYAPSPASSNNTHDAVTILNGRIVVFNQNTRDKSPTSFLELGEEGKSGLKALDIIHGTPIQIPLITNLSDVSIFRLPLEPSSNLKAGGSLFLISIRAPSPLGTGMTLAVLVENHDTPTNKVKVFGEKAWILGYEYLQTEALNRLSAGPIASSLGKDPGDGVTRIFLFAPSFIAKFKNSLSRLTDNSMAHSWTDQISRFQRYLSEGFGALGERASSLLELSTGIPILEFLTRDESLDSLPIDIVNQTESLIIGQYFDPLTLEYNVIQTTHTGLRQVRVGRNELKFVTTHRLKEHIIAKKKIDRDPKTGTYLFYQIPSTASDSNLSNAYIFFSEGLPIYLARNHHDKSTPFQAIRMPVDISPGDRLNFKRERIVVSGIGYQLVFVHRKKERSEKTQVIVVAFQEGQEFSHSFTKPLYDGPEMSFKEMTLRLRRYGNDWVFDNTSPVRGPAAYVKTNNDEPIPASEGEVPIKTTPYEKISPQGDLKQSQVYLKALSEIRISGRDIAFRQYDPAGAKFQATGFYLTPKSVIGESVFFPGFPLFNGNSNKKNTVPDYVALRKTLQFESKYSSVNMPAIRISLIPYAEKLPRKKSRVKQPSPESDSETPSDEPTETSKFNLALAANVENITYEDVSAILKNLEIPLPYKSLDFIQILQGTKSKSNEFYVLLFFRANDKIKNSSDTVLVASGVIQWTDHPDAKISIELKPFEKIHRGVVNIGSVKPHLLVDPEGNFYWAEEPTSDRRSTKFRVHKLSEPGKILYPSGGHLAQLREPDHLNENELGFTVSQNRRGGRWEIFTRYGLTDMVANLDEHFTRYESSRDKKKGKAKEGDRDGDKDSQPDETEAKSSKKNTEGKTQAKNDERSESQLIEEFEKFLDDTVIHSREQLSHPKIIVVDPALKDRFKFALFKKLAFDDGPFSLKGNRVHYYHANLALDDVEIADELDYMLERKGSGRAGFLYVDSDLLKRKDLITRDLSISDDEPDDEQEKEPARFPSVENKMPADFVALLASNGRAKTAKGLKKLKISQSRVPAFSIVTPQEWREIYDQHAVEVAAGAFDSFETNYNFLTSGWSVWPPRTEKASQDIRDLSKIPYRFEEMRVFPTLDRILNEAANGDLRGKQKIIIVPEELKSLVQKLVLLRWSTNESSAGEWSFRNKKMVLNRISGTSLTQDAVQDSFRAMRGTAATRNSVLYAELDAIKRIGRPFNKGHHDSAVGFRLRDPFKKSSSFLIDNHTSDGSLGNVKGAVQEDVETLDIETMEIEMISVQDEIDDLYNKLNNLNRRKVALPDLKHVAEINAQIQDTSKQLEKLKALRGSLESRLVELSENQDEALKLEADSSKNKMNDNSAFPHLMWWIASEGLAFQPQKNADWNLKSAVDRNIATILIGTEEELARIEEDMTFEGQFFNIREHFDITKLEAPDEPTKIQLVQQLFDRPEIYTMGIHFELNDDNGREPRSQLIYNFINHVDQLAHEQRLEKTAAFIRAYIALKNSLTEDTDLRRTRVVNEKFIKRLFTKVFPMQLNPDILEPHDPLIRLQNFDQAIRDLQATGYEGDSDLKRRFFGTVLSQTRPADSSKPIPNSQIIYGGTSTGKTFLLRMFFKMLNLQEYKRGGNNEEADYIFINVAKLTENKTDDPDKLSVEEAIYDILDLLSQPKGPRAHLVFDDFHKAASKGVREKLSQFIAGLFEAPNGMLIVRSHDKKRHREIPVQNLNLYLTLNPTANEVVRRQYVKESHRGLELLKREVLAGLSGDGFQPEESFLARWADIINLDNFPRSAKVPELVRRVRANAGRGGQMILVDPMVIDRLIDLYPGAHARELLSPATAALTTLPHSAEKAPMYVVSTRETPRKLMFPGADGGHAASQYELQGTVRDITQVDPIKSGDPQSLLRLMGFIMRNFRLQVFNHIGIEARMSDVLRVSNPGLTNLLKNNALLAFSTHIMDKPRIATAEINIRPEQFGFFTRGQLEELIKTQTAAKGDQSHFPINMDVMDRPEDLNLDRFLKGSLTSDAEAKTRREVLVETSIELEKIMEKAMQIYLRLENSSQLKEIGLWKDPQIQNWFQRLPETDPEAEFLQVSHQMLEEFFRFRERFHAPDLSDFADPSKTFHMNLYDEFRFFAYAIDKALLRLPWGQITNFTINVAEASSDFSLGTRATFREYVGNHQLSAFGVATVQFMNDMLESVIHGDDRRVPRDLKGLKEHFDQGCQSLLLISNEESEP